MTELFSCSVQVLGAGGRELLPSLALPRLLHMFQGRTESACAGGRGGLPKNAGSPAVAGPLCPGRVCQDTGCGSQPKSALAAVSPEKGVELSCSVSLL